MTITLHKLRNRFWLAYWLSLAATLCLLWCTGCAPADTWCDAFERGLDECEPTPEQYDWDDGDAVVIGCALEIGEDTGLSPLASSRLAGALLGAFKTHGQPQYEDDYHAAVARCDTALDTDLVIE